MTELEDEKIIFIESKVRTKSYKALSTRSQIIRMSNSMLQGIVVQASLEI